jgi:hypothetical protein
VFFALPSRFRFRSFFGPSTSYLETAAAPCALSQLPPQLRLLPPRLLLLLLLLLIFDASLRRKSKPVVSAGEGERASEGGE